MTRDRIKDDWPQVKPRLHVYWTELSDEDVALVDGDRNRLIGKLQEVYGLGRGDAERQIEEFERSLQVLDDPERG